MIEVESVKGYYVHAAIDEMRSGRVKGPFSDRSIANLECDGAGWYGSNGTVEEVWFLKIKGKNPGLLAEYNPHHIFEFVDIERDVKKEMTDRIKSKLTEDEIEFLNLK